MYKKIPGNNDFIISIDGDIRKTSGHFSDLEIEKDLVKIELFGITRLVDRNWLALISFYEVELSSSYENITFTFANPVPTKSFGKIMVFKKPIYYNKTHRVVPNFTRYAISKYGNIIDTHQSITVNQVTINRSYPAVYIYDPTRGFFRNVLVHRLVAYAWIPNTDYVSKPIVNHIDGNKQNFKYSNLEWCSYSENTHHAFNVLRKSKENEIKVRDIYTGEVKIYSSFKEFCLSVNLPESSKFTSSSRVKKVNLYLERYDVKVISDRRDWVILEPESYLDKNKYTITLVYENGTVEIFKTITEVMKHLKIWNISYNIKEIIKVAAVKYPGLKILVKENVKVIPVQALNARTKEVIEANSIRELSLLLKISPSTINRCLSLESPYVTKGYVFRYKSEEKWPEKLVYHPNAPVPVQAINTKTETVLEFDSVKELASYFKITYATTIKYLNSDRCYLGWNFKYHTH